jgi:hypothetical protein
VKHQGEDHEYRHRHRIKKLVDGHETVACTAREVFKIAESVSDQPV